MAVVARVISRPLLGLLIGLVILSHVSLSWEAIAPFDGPAADGPFQVYDAVRRMDAGQLPGRDFPAFHGLGLPVVHYPLYRMFGGDLFASELARQLVSRLVGVGLYLVVSWLLCGSLWPGALIAAAVWAPWPLDTRFKAWFNVGPANSLLFLRSAAPLFLMGLVFRAGPSRVWTLGLGFVLAISWLMGVEQALAVVAAVLVTATAVTVIRWKAPPIPKPRLFWALAFGVAAAVALTALMARQQTAEVIRFYLVTLPKDQVWYFGVPPNSFFGDGTRLSRMTAFQSALFCVVFLLWWMRGIWLARRASDAVSLRKGLALAVGSGYAWFSLASNLGMTNGGYLANQYRIALILAVFELWHSVRFKRWVARVFPLRPSRDDSKLRPMPSAPARWLSWGLAAVVVASLASTAIANYQHAQSPRLSDQWNAQAMVFPALIRQSDPNPATGDVWSEYAGLVEARLGIFHPQVDYIIHALGDARPAYIARFAQLQPSFVVTLRPDNFVYSEWLQTTSWGFYERLACNYELAGEAGGALLWRRTSRPWTEPATDWAPLAISSSGQQVTVPAGPAGSAIAVVRLQYATKNALGRLPIIGQQGRYLVSAVGSLERYPLSLPPRAGVDEFPVFLQPGKSAELQARVQGMALGATLRVTDAQVRYLPLTPAIRVIADHAELKIGR